MPAQYSFTLPVQAPFDWRSLLAFLQRRATPGVEIVSDSAYTRTLGEGSALHKVSVTHDRARSTLQIWGTGVAEAGGDVERRVQQLFRPDVNTASIETFLGRDRRLKQFVAQHPGLRVPGGWSALEVAARAVLGQQISVPAATTLMGRLVRLAGTKVDEHDWLFPSAQQVVVADLSGLGVPRKRLETLKSMAALLAEQGDDCLQKSDAMDRLLAINGVGRWTAGYILMRTTANHDHWPEGDLVLRKALSRQKQLMDAASLSQMFSRWSPYRSYAAIHIWRGYVSTDSAIDQHRS